MRLCWLCIWTHFPIAVLTFVLRSRREVFSSKSGVKLVHVFFAAVRSKRLFYLVIPVDLYGCFIRISLKPMLKGFLDGAAPLVYGPQDQLVLIHCRICWTSWLLKHSFIHGHNLVGTWYTSVISITNFLCYKQLRQCIYKVD